LKTEDHIIVKRLDRSEEIIDTINDDMETDYVNCKAPKSKLDLILEEADNIFDDVANDLDIWKL